MSLASGLQPGFLDGVAVCSHGASLYLRCHGNGKKPHQSLGFKILGAKNRGPSNTAAPAQPIDEMSDTIFARGVVNRSEIPAAVQITTSAFLHEIDCLKLARSASAGERCQATFSSSEPSSGKPREWDGLRLRSWIGAVWPIEAESSESRTRVSTERPHRKFVLRAMCSTMNAAEAGTKGTSFDRITIVEKYLGKDPFPTTSFESNAESAAGAGQGWNRLGRYSSVKVMAQIASVSSGFLPTQFENPRSSRAEASRCQHGRPGRESSWRLPRSAGEGTLLWLVHVRPNHESPGGR